MSKRWEARDTVSGPHWVSFAKIISSACNVHPKAWEEGAAPGGKCSSICRKITAVSSIFKGGKSCREHHQGWGRKVGTHPGLREKAKGGLPDGALALFNKLGQSRSLWTVHGSNRRRSSKRMITLDPNHFGFDGRGGQRGGSRLEETSKGRENLPYPGPTSMVVSWVGRCQVKVTSGGELDFEC